MDSPVTYPEKIKTEDTRTRVLFVCTGNTCRSPMAAAVLNALAPDRFIASSAGLSCSDGKPMSENAALALSEAGITPPPHASRQITRGIVEQNDIIIGLTGSHFMVLLGAFPDLAGKIESMPRDVGDPWGGSLAEYKASLSAITECIKERFGL